MDPLENGGHLEVMDSELVRLEEELPSAFSKPPHEQLFQQLEDDRLSSCFETQQEERMMVRLEESEGLPWDQHLSVSPRSLH